MKRLYITPIVILLLSPLGAQDESFRMLPESPSVIARISLAVPSFIMEIAPSDHFTFTTGFWVRPVFWPEDNHGDHTFSAVPELRMRLTMEPRYYFNLESRYERGKRIDYYSGWYMGMPFSMAFNPMEYSVGTTIGFQCTFGRRWFWNIGAGPGFKLSEGKFQMDAATDVGFGIILN